VTFVLLGTRSPGNLGAVCRVAAAFGFPSVRLVRPELDPGHEEARWLAHGAERVLAAVTVHDELGDALRGCSRSVATTARTRHGHRAVLEPAEVARRLAVPAAPGPLAIVLGPEDRGLTNDELARCDEVMSIPLPGDTGATLSLPAAASILAWELSRTRRPDAAAAAPPTSPAALDSASVDDLLGGIESTLAEIGFRPRPDAVRFRGSLRDFLARARPTDADRRLLRHVFAQVGKWKRRVRGEARREASR